MDRKTQKIAELNDAFRLNPADSGIPGQTLMTQGINALPEEDQINIFTRVRCFNDFTEDNDPYGERDFGSFVYQGQKIVWKIDYYANDMKHGSENPADPKQTVRVLTIMLASEY